MLIKTTRSISQLQTRNIVATNRFRYIRMASRSCHLSSDSNFPDIVHNWLRLGYRYSPGSDLRVPYAHRDLCRRNTDEKTRCNYILKWKTSMNCFVGMKFILIHFSFKYTFKHNILSQFDLKNKVCSFLC